MAVIKLYHASDEVIKDNEGRKNELYTLQKADIFIFSKENIIRISL